MRGIKLTEGGTGGGVDLAAAVLRACKGDKAAYRHIFERLVDPVFSFVLSHSGDRERAEDIVQDTFVDLWSALPSFTYRSEKEFFGFVFTIARRKLGKMLEAKKKAPASLDALLEGECHRDVSLDGPLHSEDHRHLLAAIGKLSAGYRELLALRYWSECSFGEVASALGITENTAKVRHHRAMNQLREIIAKGGYYEHSL